MWLQDLRWMALRGVRYLTIIFGLTICVLIVSYIILGMNLSSMKYTLQRREYRKVDKHFFFEMLPSFDHSFRMKLYSPSKLLPASQFFDIADRVLITRYLSERFAYSSFIQLGCRKERVFQMLSDSVVTTKLCVDDEVGTVSMTPEKFFNGSVVAMQRFDLIMIEPYFVTPSLIDMAFSHLTEGGALLLTDVNPSGSTIPVLQNDLRVVNILLSMRRRTDLDIATVDVDGGIAIIYGRRNSAPLELPPEGVEQYQYPLPSANTISSAAVSNTRTGSDIAEAYKPRTPADHGGTLPGVGLGSVNDAVVQASHQNNIALNLMRFEDVHDWLAATGNVDALTAFGGAPALGTFRESLKFQSKCSEYAADVTTQDRALGCFQEAAAANRLSLTARWQMAMLQIQHNKLVDAVTTLNQLQSLSPEYYKWMLSQVNSQTAQQFMQKIPNGATALKKKRQQGTMRKDHHTSVVPGLNRPASDSDAELTAAIARNEQQSAMRKTTMATFSPIVGGSSETNSTIFRATSTSTSTAEAPPREPRTDVAASSQKDFSTLPTTGSSNFAGAPDGSIHGNAKTIAVFRPERVLDGVSDFEEVSVGRGRSRAQGRAKGKGRRRGNLRVNANAKFAGPEDM